MKLLKWIFATVYEIMPLNTDITMIGLISHYYGNIGVQNEKKNPDIYYLKLILKKYEF